MAYIGREPTVGNFQVCDAISVVNGQAAYTMQVGGVNVVPESANHMLVSLNGILQAPTSSFTVSGSTITFASNLVTGDVIDFIQILGNVLDLGVPSDSTVSLAKLTATGTKDATTFLRGDNTFAAAGGGKVLQVLQSTLTSDISTTAGSYTDTGLSLAITPAATNSKVLFSMSMNFVRKSGDTQVAFRVIRGSTTIVSDIGNMDTGDGQQITDVVNFQFLDSPSTSSAVTYKIQYKSGNGSVSSASSRISTLILTEIGA